MKKFISFFNSRIFAVVATFLFVAGSLLFLSPSSAFASSFWNYTDYSTAGSFVSITFAVPYTGTTGNDEYLNSVTIHHNDAGHDEDLLIEMTDDIGTQYALIPVGCSSYVAGSTCGQVLGTASTAVEEILVYNYTTTKWVKESDSSAMPVLSSSHTWQIHFTTRSHTAFTFINTGNFYGPSNIDTRTSGVTTHFGIVATTQTTNPLIPVPSITSFTPSNGATAVSTYTNFSGTYDNDGTYNSVIVLLQDDTHSGTPLVIDVCDTAGYGSGLTYSCSHSTLTSTNYSYSVALNDDSVPLLAHSIDGMSGTPWTFITDSVTTLPPEIDTGSCASLDIFCYIASSINWIFWPSPQSLANFSLLTLKYSFPFSYLYDLPVLYADAFDHAPVNINIGIDFGTFGHIDLLTTAKLEAVPFQSTVRTVLGALMLFGTAMFIYKKVIRVHDSGHKTV